MRFEVNIGTLPANQEEYTALILYANRKGVPIYRGTWRDKLTDFEEFPILAFGLEENVIGRYKDGNHGTTLITQEQFKEACDNWAADHIPASEPLPAGEDVTKEQFIDACDNWAADRIPASEPLPAGEDVTKETIARMVKDHLEQTGISGRKFAKEAGVSHGTINEMLAENRHDPKLGTSVLILKALGKKVKIID